MIEQAECRAHRIGQTEPVTVTFLVTEGKSTDPIIWRILNRKMNTASRVQDNERKRLGARAVTLQRRTAEAPSEKRDGEPLEAPGKRRRT